MAKGEWLVVIDYKKMNAANSKVSNTALLMHYAAILKCKRERGRDVITAENLQRLFCSFSSLSPP